MKSFALLSAEMIRGLTHHGPIHWRVRHSTLAAGLVLAAVGLPAMGQPVSEDGKLLRSSPTEMDRFGDSVAIYGNYCIISSAESSINPGNAFIFEISNGTELYELIGSDVEPNDDFGCSVAIRDNKCLVGAIDWDNPNAGSNSENEGAVYVFTVSTGSQSNRLALSTSEARSNDEFGHSVALIGSSTSMRAVIGAPGVDTLSGGLPQLSESGAAYVFGVNSGNRLTKLTASDGDTGDRFGWAVAADGTKAIIGAPFHDDGENNNNLNYGAAYIFSGSTYPTTETFKLSLNDQSPVDLFGFSVAMDGGYAIVGAPGRDGIGAAYVFDASTGDLLHELTPSDGQLGDDFGYSVSISGCVGVIGAWRSDDAGNLSGSAYVFDTSTGEEIAKITSSDATAGDTFGVSVAIDDFNSVIGARLDDDVEFNAGSAYVFSLPCPGDVTGDRVVNLDDLNTVLANFGESTSKGDANGDGVVNLADMNLVNANFGERCVGADCLN